ncbi:MAG: transporter substrate-binding domain-containing protein [Duganella sp.]
MKTLLFAAALAASAPAVQAGSGCSRPISVPLSPSGSSVIAEMDKVRGIYPDVLRGVAEKIGCKFEYTMVPRARLVALYQLGQADLFLPASPTPERDRHGTFVPLVSIRPVLISLEGNHAPISSAQDLLARRDLRVAVVRGFDYGEGYTALTSELAKQGRLFVEVDVTAVARLLHAGSADLTIMGPSLIISVAQREQRVQGMLERLRTEAIAELPWRYSGVYVSKALAREDQQVLIDGLEKSARANQFIDSYRRYFGGEMLNSGVRARDARESR